MYGRPGICQGAMSTKVKVEVKGRVMSLSRVQTVSVPSSEDYHAYSAPYTILFCTCSTLAFEVHLKNTRAFYVRHQPSPVALTSRGQPSLACLTSEPGAVTENVFAHECLQRSPHDLEERWGFPARSVGLPVTSLTSSLFVTSGLPSTLVYPWSGKQLIYH
ncbi:hypothetical protein NDU88_001976 [Pleurodeles waltl]|uniref:Uncharacterized protein n=1 Tax=Pleurodeles waltl TaxID=8319 RepID=A0AAV7U7Y4_PLEWA|nr:hypothetical protein NDU88_001976 [Pleurodeles waltl]